MLTDSTNIFETINPPAGAQQRRIIAIGAIAGNGLTLLTRLLAGMTSAIHLIITEANG